MQKCTKKGKSNLWTNLSTLSDVLPLLAIHVTDGICWFLFTRVTNA